MMPIIEPEIIGIMIFMIETDLQQDIIPVILCRKIQNGQSNQVFNRYRKQNLVKNGIDLPLRQK